MPNKLTRKMQSFEGVAAGQTAVCRLTNNLTIHQLLVAFSGATLAQLDEVRLVLNGKAVIRITEVSKLNSYNLFDGRATAGTVFVLDLDRFGLRTREGEEFTSLGMGVPNDPQRITTASLEIDINAAAVGPVLSCKAVVSAPRPLGLIKHIREFTKSPGGAGTFEISDIPRLGVINRIFFDDSVVGINSVRIERDGYTIFERTTAENELMQADGVRVPQAGYWIIDPTEGGNGIEGIEYGQDVQDLRLYLDVAGAGQLPYAVEYIGPLNN